MTKNNKMNEKRMTTKQNRPMQLHDPKDDPVYYKTICDNFYPIHCTICGENFGKDSSALAKHYDTHYTRKSRGKQ